jgi:hypothetical protein
MLRAVAAALLLLVCHGQAEAQTDWISGPRGVPSSTGFEFFDVFNPAITAAEEPWTADRPARTPRPTTLPKQTRQLEAGYEFHYRDRDATIRRTHAAPELLYRYAPLGAVELRVGWSYAWESYDSRAGSLELSGSNNVTFGTKTLLTSQAGPRPEQSVLIEARVPTGGSPLASDDVGFALDYLAGWSFDRWAVYGSTGLETLSEASDSYSALHQSFVLATPLGAHSQVAFEYLGRYSHGRAVDFNEQSVDLSLAWQATDRLQFDLLVGLGLTSDADDFFAAAGGVLRF